jgi:hypothetical protein
MRGYWKPYYYDRCAGISVMVEREGGMMECIRLRGSGVSSCSEPNR